MASRYGARSRRDGARVDRAGRSRRTCRARQRVGQRAPLPPGQIRRVRRPVRRGDGAGDEPHHRRTRSRPGAAARSDPLRRGRGLPRRAVERSLHRRPRARLSRHRVRGVRWPSPRARRPHRRVDRDLPPGMVRRAGGARRPFLPTARSRRHPVAAPAGRPADHARRSPPERHRPRRRAVRPLLHGRRHGLGGVRAGDRPQPRSDRPRRVGRAALSRRPRTPRQARRQPAVLTQRRRLPPPRRPRRRVGGARRGVHAHPPGVRRLVRPRSGRIRDVVSRPADAGAGRSAPVGDPPRHARRHRPRAGTRAAMSSATTCT